MKAIKFLPFEHFNANFKPLQAYNYGLVESFFNKVFNKNHTVITKNGREAISIILKSLCLQFKDEIYITTTFDFPNVSSCVTSTIFNYCKPSRVLSSDTKAIFVIHEFGVPHPHLLQLKNTALNLGIPLIEDCAHTFLSESKGIHVGKVGDYTLTSLSKFFPVNKGGILSANSEISRPCQPLTIYDLQILEHEIKNIDTAKEKRRLYSKIYKENLFHGEALLNDYLNDDIVPWFFPVRFIDSSDLIEYLNRVRIDAGIWHGTNLVVLPLHQFITEEEVLSICKLINDYYAKK
ncbi:MAG: DegT/DnrJ/EryC1/StrS family aminotransferase [Bacteroidota bacterium]